MLEEQFSGFSISEDSAERLIDFMSEGRSQVAHGGDASDMGEFIPLLEDFGLGPTAAKVLGQQGCNGKGLRQDHGQPGRNYSFVLFPDGVWAVRDGAFARQSRRADVPSLQRG